MTSNTPENQLKRGPFIVDSFVRRAFWTIVALSSITFLGCKSQADFSEFPARTLIAPLAEKVPYDFEGTVRRNWGGDEFEIIEGRVIHYVRLVGVMGPEPGQPDWRKASRLLWKGFVGKNARVRVIGRDECMCEIGSIRVGNVDFGLQLLENGMGCVDVDSRFDASKAVDLDAYRQADSQARESKMGIWKREPARMPSQYRKQQDESYLEFLRTLNGHRG